jgi:hypothetical protein
VKDDNTATDPKLILAEIDSLEQSTLAAFERLRGLVAPETQKFDPRDPRNKGPDGKLTERGVEICHRLFDQGKTPYAVGNAMRIAFGSAMNRYQGWKSLGGVGRKKKKLDC